MTGRGKLFPFMFVAFTLPLSGRASACRNVEISRVPSPSAALSAVMFNRDCGTTTSFSTQVSIVTDAQQPLGTGNIFRAGRQMR